MEVFKEVLQPLVEILIPQDKHHVISLMMKTLHHRNILGKAWIVNKFVSCFVFPFYCCGFHFFSP